MSLPEHHGKPPEVRQWSICTIREMRHREVENPVMLRQLGWGASLSKWH
jgi:hypothetical protein